MESLRMSSEHHRTGADARRRRHEEIMKGGSTSASSLSSLSSQSFASLINGKRSSESCDLCSAEPVTRSQTRSASRSALEDGADVHVMIGGRGGVSRRPYAVALPDHDDSYDVCRDDLRDACKSSSRDSQWSSHSKPPHSFTQNANTTGDTLKAMMRGAALNTSAEPFSGESVILVVANPSMPRRCSESIIMDGHAQSNRRSADTIRRPLMAELEDEKNKQEESFFVYVTAKPRRKKSKAKSATTIDVARDLFSPRRRSRSPSPCSLTASTTRVGASCVLPSESDQMATAPGECNEVEVHPTHTDVEEDEYPIVAAATHPHWEASNILSVSSSMFSVSAISQLNVSSCANEQQPAQPRQMPGIPPVAVSSRTEHVKEAREDSLRNCLQEAHAAMSRIALPLFCWQCGARYPHTVPALFCGVCGSERVVD